MYGLAFGIVIGAIFYLFGNNASLTLHHTSQFWMYWYGFWNLILGIFVLLSTFGITAGGAMTGGAAGGILGGLMGSVAGAGGSVLLMWIPFLARCTLLIGGPHLMWTATMSDLDVPRTVIGAVLLLLGLLITRPSSNRNNNS